MGCGDRAPTAIRAALLLAGALSIAACSGAVTDGGGVSASNSSSALSASSSVSALSAVSSDAAASTTSISPTSTVATKTSSTPSASKTSNTPLGPATLLSLTFSPPACGTSTSAVDFTLSWTSKNATEVWIENSAVAVGLQGADPKTDGNGTQLSNPSKGSVRISYPCGDTTDQYHYYLLEVYNPSNTTMDGQTQQVPRS